MLRVTLVSIKTITC